MEEPKNDSELDLKNKKVVKKDKVNAYKGMNKSKIKEPIPITTDGYDGKVKIDTKDSVNTVDNSSPEPSVVLGETTGPVINATEAVDSMINKIMIDSSLPKITITPSDTTSSEYFKLAFEVKNLSVSVPTIKYKRLTDIVKWLDYELVGGKRYKIIKLYPYKLGESDISTIEKMIQALVNIWLKMTDDYDGVYVDSDDPITNTFSQLSSKRLVRNNLLSTSDNINPLELLNKLQLFRNELPINIEQVKEAYYLELVTRKNEIDNLRYGVPILMDQVSYDMFTRFTNNPNDLTELPRGMRYGMYDLNAEFANIRQYATQSIRLLPRKTGYDKDSNLNRSFVREFSLNEKFINFIVKYRLNLIYINDKFSKAFLAPLINTIKIMYRERNIVRDYYAATKLGLTRLRTNLDTQVQSGYVASLATSYMNFIYLLLANPEAYFIIEDLSSPDNDPVWVLDKVFFLYFMKPQVTLKNYAGILVRTVMNVISSKANITADVNDPLGQLLQNVAPYISNELYVILTEWVNYSDGVYDAIYEALLYDNLGNLAGNNDQTGFNFWKAGAYNPFRIIFQNVIDSGPLITLQNALLFTNRNAGLQQWGETLSAVISVASTAGGANFSRTMYIMQHQVLKSTSLPMYVNRFAINRWQPVVCNTKSFFSFLVGAVIEDQVRLEINGIDMVRYLFHEQIWFSKGIMFYRVLRVLDNLVTLYSGLQGTNGFFLKEHVTKFKVASLLPECMFKDILNLTLGEAGLVRDLDSLTSGTLLYENYFRDLQNIFGGDFGIGDYWNIYAKTFEFISDFRNLRFLGIHDSFIYGKPNIITTGDSFRRKVVNVPVAINYVYKRNILRFGLSDMKRDLSRIQSLNGAVRITIPTLFIMKKVVDFSEDESGFDNGKTKILDWMRAPKAPVSVEDGTMHFAVVTNEISDLNDIKYNDLYYHWESTNVYVEDGDDYYTHDYNDLQQILLPPLRRYDLLLQELTENTGEIYPGFPGTNRLEYLATFL